MFAVYAEYSVAPVSLDDAGIVEIHNRSDFAAYAASRGCVQVTDSTKFGGNVTYDNPVSYPGPAFIVKVGEYADRAVAEACAEAVKVAGRSTR